MDVNFLRKEDEEFPEDVDHQFDSKGKRHAEAILSKARQLFASSELTEDDKLNFLLEIHQLFLDSMKRAKKYTPRKYLREDEDE